MARSVATPDSGDSSSKLARVLLVEDHPALRDAVAQLISADDELFVPVAVQSAEEALARFREADPDLAVVDISLPGMDGIELIRRLRRLEPDLPIIVLSSHSVERWEAPALEAGARAYLIKSRAPRDLVAMIRETLSGDGHRPHDHRHRHEPAHAG